MKCPLICVGVLLLSACGPTTKDATVPGLSDVAVAPDGAPVASASVAPTTQPQLEPKADPYAAASAAASSHP